MDIISKNIEDCHAEFLRCLDREEYWYTFTQIYHGHSLPSNEKNNLLQSGNRIIMPPSSLDRLMNMMHIAYPMMFQICNVSNRRVSHCGIEEFTGEEGSIFLPKFVMDNLELAEGGAVILKNVNPSRGTYMKLQPHTKDFLDLYDHKDVLETQLKKFSCVTSGDTIMINHNERNFYIDVLETKPSNAVSLIDTDCEVDFACPLDYKDPEKPATNLIVKNVEEKEAKEADSKRPFSGVSRRLDEKLPQ